MTAALRPHIVVLSYWLVIVLMAAFFLRQACSLCRANMPTWKRSIISVLLVTFLAYLIFDFTAYLMMRTLDGVALRVPPGYGYHIWFREALGLKWLIIASWSVEISTHRLASRPVSCKFLSSKPRLVGWGFARRAATLATYTRVYRFLVLTIVLQSTG